MGTVNFRTSEYITLGTRPYECYECENGDCCSICQSVDYDVYTGIVNKYNFYHFNLEVKGGYYEGCSLIIEYDDEVFSDSYEKREAQKEITLIKKVLVELADNGMRACYPSWCTGYEDYNGTMAEIKKAIKEMRADVNKAYTERTWELEWAKKTNEGLA